MFCFSFCTSVAAVVLKSEISAQLVNSSVTEESRNVSYVTTAPLQNDVSKVCMPDHLKTSRYNFLWVKIKVYFLK